VANKSVHICAKAEDCLGGCHALLVINYCIYCETRENTFPFALFNRTIQANASSVSLTAAPQFTAAPVGCELRLFTTVTPAEVIQMVRALPDKQCSTDPMPTRLLNENVDLLAPFLSQLLCWSLQHGVVPTTMKSAYIKRRF